MMGPLLEGWERQVKERGDALAIGCGRNGGGLSFRELGRASEQRQNLLPERLDSPVAVCLANGASFVEVVLALRRHGVPVALLDASLTPMECTQQCRALGIRWLCMHGALNSTSRYDLGSGVALHELERSDLDPDPRCLVPGPAPEGTAFVKLTSGSTGSPVGVCLSESALEAGIRQIAAGMQLTAADRVLMSVPLSHSYGFDNGFVSLLVLGTPLVLRPPSLPGGLLSTIVQHEISFLPLVPPVVYALSRIDWPSCPKLRMVISAGGRLHDDVAQQFLETSGRPVHQFYGSTESGGISFERRPLEAAAAGCVGEPLPGVSVDLVDGGRVTVDSPANFIGYFGVDRTPQLRTVQPGDLAEWSAEGRLRLLGRMQEMLNVGGKKIATSTIEDALRAIDGVEEVAVVGIEDRSRGDRVVAFYVGAADEVDLATVPRRLQPRAMRRLEALPRTARGKLDRGALRQTAARALPDLDGSG